MEYNLVEKFFYTKFRVRRCNGSEVFPHLKNLIYATLTVPVSTPNVERIFSQKNLNKTKLRNKLEIPTLCGILRRKDLKKDNGDCTI